MAITFTFFHDSALTQEVTSGNPVSVVQDTTGGQTITPVQLWFGSTASGFKVQATSNPGTDPITITPTDAAPGTGQSTAAVRIATSSGGCAGATPGAALSVGTTITSGVGNAFPFWVLPDDETSVVGVYTELSLDTNGLTESAV